MSDIKNFTTHALHVTRSNGYYLGQVRRAGFSKWDAVTGKCRTMERALEKAAKHFSGNFKLRVLFIDCSGWYEPAVMFEGKR